MVPKDGDTIPAVIVNSQSACARQFFIHLSVSLSIHLFVSVCPSIHLSVRPSICMSVRFDSMQAPLAIAALLLCSVRKDFV